MKCLNLLVTAALLLALNPTSAVAENGDASRGQTKAAVCGACHGADGNSINSMWPSLAGQHVPYLVQRLKNYKENSSKYPVMGAQASGLSEQDMHDLAAYFSTLTVKPGAADPEKVTLGSELYRLGNDDDEIASCAACHGPRGHGNPAANMPSIAGQRSDYVVAQLKAFANGNRSGGLNNMMSAVSKNMSEKQMTAVAAYLEGLH